ncbi:hypothetical protein BKA64DRAFT_742064 [Cadophora sp. MPI-SDFR-AT-0126]|nr:hypothetical protein BKA64DRAFT_751188 [Leotiomycetes sp. MPI-SDFR-AT-0126]KAH7408850.1 hypothetical protein BKA64DRAFT_742064 [Leotiomycetes sp. MPI-SDFR-AT-0126]
MMPLMDAVSFKHSFKDMAMRTPIVHIQHFLALFDNIRGGGGKKIEVENPTHLSNNGNTIASKRPFQARNSCSGCEAPDSDGSDPLQSDPEPKRRRILPIGDESDDQLSSDFQTSKVVSRKRRQKPKAYHQRKSLCSDEGTDTGSKPDFSDADDEDNMSQECAEIGEDVSVPIMMNAACFYWRKHHIPSGQESTHPYDLTLKTHSALEQFSYAYHVAQITILHRVVLDILYRADLAHLHEVYLGTLEYLSRFSSQEKKVAKSRPLEAFDGDVRSVAVH